MDEFISLVTQQLGIGEQESRSAVGGILKIVKEQLDDSAFGDLMQQLPGAEAMIGESGDAAGSGGGLMGSLTSMAGSLLGGEGGAGAIAKALGDAGIGLDKAGGFVAALVSFLKDKLGEEAFTALAAQLPDLLGNKD